jgi:hypothetical protein
MKDAGAYILYTTPYHAITANLQLQYNIFGHCIRIIDYGANLSTQQISITSITGAYVDGVLTKVYNTNSLRRELLNIGNNFIAL